MSKPKLEPESSKSVASNILKQKNANNWKNKTGEIKSVAEITFHQYCNQKQPISLRFENVIIWCKLHQVLNSIILYNLYKSKASGTILSRKRNDYRNSRWLGSLKSIWWSTKAQNQLKFIICYGFWKTEFYRYFKYAAYTSDILSWLLIWIDSALVIR